MSTPPTKAELYAFAMVADEIGALMRRFDGADDDAVAGAMGDIKATLAAVHLDFDVFVDRLTVALCELLRSRGIDSDVFADHLEAAFRDELLRRRRGSP